MNRVSHVVFALLVGCGGAVADGEAPRSGPYLREQTETVPTTAPHAVAMLGVSCEAGEVLVEGGCDVSAGGGLVENQTTGLGWTCAATSARDDMRLHVWIRCDH